jgi:hypothetical protein
MPLRCPLLLKWLKWRLNLKGRKTNISTFSASVSLSFCFFSIFYANQIAFNLFLISFSPPPPFFFPLAILFYFLSFSEVLYPLYCSSPLFLSLFLKPFFRNGIIQYFHSGSGLCRNSIRVNRSGSRKTKTAAVKGGQSYFEELDVLSGGLCPNL